MRFSFSIELSLKDKAAPHIPEKKIYQQAKGETIEGKICSMCREFKKDSKFHIDNSWKGGLQSYCRECKSKYSKNINKKIGKEKGEDVVLGEKSCPMCGYGKPLSKFAIARKNKNGLQSYCKKCACIYAKKRFILCRKNSLI